MRLAILTFLSFFSSSSSSLHLLFLSSLFYLLLPPNLSVGVKSPPMSWEGWPRYLLDPYHAVKTEANGNTTTTAGI